MKIKLRSLILLLSGTMFFLMFFQNCGGGGGGGGSSSVGALGPVLCPSVSSTGLQVQFSWSQPSTGTPTGFIVERSTDNVNFCQSIQVDGNTTTATVGGLTSQKYFFRISAFNQAAETPSQAVVVDLSTH